MSGQGDPRDPEKKAEKKIWAPLAPGGSVDTLGRASLMGLHLVSGMIVGAALGYGLDAWLDRFPLCSAIGFFFGIGAGFRNVWLESKGLISTDPDPRARLQKGKTPERAKDGSTDRTRRPKDLDDEPPAQP